MVCDLATGGLKPPTSALCYAHRPRVFVTGSERRCQEGTAVGHDLATQRQCATTALKPLKLDHGAVEHTSKLSRPPDRRVQGNHVTT